jgi:IclR family transcriptional regulator, KDG regulon repressor
LHRGIGARMEQRRVPRSRGGASSLQVLERAFAVLALFSVERPEWTTTEIARESNLPIPTAHRILSTLRHHGFVSRDERTKRFRLGAAALELGERARAVVDIRSIALPVLRQLTHETGETSLLTVLNEGRDRSVCLERVESPHPLRLSLQPGRQLPLHAGASQKVLFAFMSEEEIERVLSGPLDRLWRATITDPQTLRGELGAIRSRGWATSFEETNAGVWGLAVPILDNGGDIVAGVGLAGPSARVAREEIGQHLARLSEATDAIARLLGCRTPARVLARPTVAAAEPRRRSTRGG